MEKAMDESELRRWTDHIPLRWKYTAGVAGERFLQLLKQGTLQASFCKDCNKLFLPPKIFCKDCFTQLTDWKDVDVASAYVYSHTRVRSQNGKEKDTLVLVKFDGVEGGLIGRFKPGREDPKIGMKVRPVFKPKQERKGSISDIEYFERAV
jgi:uncharacterized OB-fold protein